jgi:hypothetical protein
MTTRNFFVNHGLECGDIVISAVNNTITGLATAAPSADGDVSNKKYVDDQDALIASDTLTFTNKTIDANGTGNSITNLEVADFAGSAIINVSETLASNDSDTALVTAGAIIDYVDAQDANIAGDTLTFTNKTFDANGTGNSISNIETADFASAAFKDEDDLSSDSATAVASQQSIKAYIDNGLSSLSSTTLTAGNTTAVVSDTGSDGAFTVTAEGNTELVINDTSATFSGNVIVTGDFTVNGTTTTVATTNTTINDNLIELNTGISASSNDAGLIIERGSTGNNAAIIWDESADKFAMGTTTATAADKSGGISVSTGTLVANIEGNVTGAVTGNADTATEATNVTVTANNTANETVYLTFVDGATGTQGIETDTGLSYNPSTNVLTTTASQAQYADLAEKYTTSTGDLEPGTVVRVTIGPGNGDMDILPEVEPAMQDSIPVGVISTAPAYLMNSNSEGQAVALKGRVPVKVTGAVTKGQAVYVDDNGHATASNTGSIMVGVALESNGDSSVKLVECVLKV